MEMQAWGSAFTAGAAVSGVLLVLVRIHRARQDSHQQRFHEFESQQRHEQNEHAAEVARQDSEQRRITDMRFRSVEQLDSLHPSSRISGLHELERIGDQHPETRQTILDQICAYLRLPYAPPIEAKTPSRQFEPIGPAPSVSERSKGEREVRLIAQDILQRHLKTRGHDADRYWPHTRLNLRGAYLEDIRLTESRLSHADFRNATFAGHASFNRTEFAGFANFAQAHFKFFSNFGGTRFEDGALFNEAKFTWSAIFSKATFIGEATFYETQFSSAYFIQTNFRDRAVFESDTFGGPAVFEGARFTLHVGFNGAKFDDVAIFTDARFCSSASLPATFAKAAGFAGASFADFADFTHAAFGAEVEFDEAIFHGDVYMRRSTLPELIGDSFVRFDPTRAHKLPDDWMIVLDPCDLSTGYLARRESAADKKPASPGADLADPVSATTSFP